MIEMMILVDQNDNEIGTLPKLETHEKGLLHRAFSIFIFNNQGQMLLQQRAAAKYHSPLLWTNACCSHPRLGETVLQAAQRRLQEEMGFVTGLTPKFSFIYKAEFDNGLTEHELDHVLVGTFDGTPVINKEEVEDYKWMSMNELNKDMMVNPHLYTVWFTICMNEYLNHLK